MAEKLKQQFDIIVLKTQLLDVARDEPDVRFTLQCKIEGRLEDIQIWTGHTSLMGLRETIDSRKIASGAEPDIKLPEDILNELNAWLHEETNRDRPLWVHLVKPYGALRLVPWERLLGSVLQVPILMLPDFIFPPPREAPATLDVVLCGSAPLGSEENSIYYAVALAARRILNGSPRRNRIHIFVDAQFADALRNEWGAAGKLGNEVLVYDNSMATRFVEEDPSSRLVDRAGVLRSPWLLWMREALRGRAVDVAHFCCHGYLARGRGALLFAQSPLDRSDNFLSGPVGAVELQTFLTQVGAWSSAFTSVSDNFSEPGLRALADEIAQNRPGPMILHNLRIDPDAVALAAGYHFIYANTPEAPPLSTALFIYCQPYLSSDAVNHHEHPVSTLTPERAFGGPKLDVYGFETPKADAVSPPILPITRGHPALDELARNPMQQEQAARTLVASPLDPLFRRDENVATWIATTERFAEQVELRYQALARDDLLPEKMREHQTRLAMETIDNLRMAVSVEVDKAPSIQTGKTPGIEGTS